MNLQQLSDRISQIESDLKQLQAAVRSKPAPVVPAIERKKPGPKPKVQHEHS